MTMTADDIMELLRSAWSNAAIVTELRIDDEHELTRIDGKHEALVRRIDGLMFDSLIRTAIEIKIDKRDAARETWAKVRPWRRVTHRFLYATPVGLIENPPIFGCGLVWVHKNGRVEWVRKCSVNRTPEPLPQKVVEALAYRAATGFPKPRGKR